MSCLLWACSGVVLWLFWGLSYLWLVGVGLVLDVGVLDCVVMGEDFGCGGVVGGSGYLMVGVLLLVYAVVMLFGYYYMCGEMLVGVFNWVVFVFVVGVLLLLLSSGLYVVFVGWEVLGIVSFVLIGFYGSRVGWASALYTVFMNRVGDVAVMMLFCVLAVVGGVGWIGAGVLCGSVAVLLVVCVVTKSAQVPFGSWLPLAMAAPTPVSALVHSSTLVIAGLFVGWVYGGCLFGVGSVLLLVLGVGTVVVSGLSAAVEMDFKKVVAYSTSMHLGLMVCMAVGFSWVFMGVHMQLHAVFKSLLFVAVGLVILGASHDQDYRGGVVGGRVAGVVGVLVIGVVWSLVGLTYFSGWVTKDVFMESLLGGGWVFILWLVVMLGLGFSGVYGFKLVVMLVVDSVGKVPMLSGCLLLSGFWVFVWGLYLVLGISWGVWYSGVCLEWDESVGVVSWGEKFLYLFLVVLLYLVWNWVLRGCIGLGALAYGQGVVSSGVVGLSWFLLKHVVGFEVCWLSGLGWSLCRLCESVVGKVVSVMVWVDWYLVVGMMVWVVVVGVVGVCQRGSVMCQI